MNFKNLIDLKSLITLNTSKKLKSFISMLNAKAKRAGIERSINTKSNLFQFNLK